MSGRSRIPSFRYRVRGWVSREVFEKLIEFSDYLGREGGESKFVINPEKAEKNNIVLEDIIDILKSLTPQVSETVVNALEEYASRRERVILETEGGRFIIKPLTYLGEKFEAIRGLVRYDRRRKVFIVEPGVMRDVVEKLSSMGVSVEDRSGIPQSLPLPEKIEFTGKLRDYQEEALEKWINSNRRGIIALPTGSGKTIIGVAAIAKVSERTLVVTFTKEQLHQWIDKILELTTINKTMISAFYSGEKRLAPITVTTYQTAFRNIELLAFRYSMLIVDEVHHLPADKFKRIALGMYSPCRMGLSATVVREDGRHTELFPLMGGIVYHKSPQELIDKGYLAPYSNFIVRVRLTEEERRKYEELRKIYRALAMDRPFTEIVKAAQRGDQLAAKALKVHSELRQLVQKASQKEKAVKEIVERELARGSKIIVFTQYVDQARKLGELLNAPVITGSVDDKKRKRILEEFRASSRGVLVITTVGDEGLDIPDANVGVIVAGTGSRRQFIQRLGRLLRPQEGKTARLYEIVVTGTPEEAQARKRKRISLEDTFASDASNNLSE